MHSKFKIQNSKLDKPAIRAEHLTKIYRLYDKSNDRLKEALHPFGKKYHHDFYALSDVSFEIQAGETVGIVGKNGAGKSTLLKIIAGVLTPSDGEVEVNGRVASLLELGAGFNPEYSGMENIFLQGMLMGYSQKESEAKVESIVAFADIGEFVHQKVSMYSSGMFARLAFAIVVHLEPDVLIVDEALSVGDLAFQYKCFMKFQEFQKEGRTILFVSHSAQQIMQYCSRAILIDGGRLIENSQNVQQLLFNYEMLLRSHAKRDDAGAYEEKCFDGTMYDFDTTPNVAVQEHRFGTHEAIVRDVVLSRNANATLGDGVVYAGDVVYLRFFILAKREFSSVVLGSSIKNRDGNVLWGGNTLGENISLQEGLNIVTMEFCLNIVGGEYLLFCGLADISKEPRVELDQRWPVEKITIVSLEKSAEGFVYAPVKIRVESVKQCM